MEDAGRTRLTQQEIDMLLSKETIRVKPSKGKKKGGVQDLFGGEVGAAANAENQLQNWQQLGTPSNSYLPFPRYWFTWYFIS